MGVEYNHLGEECKSRKASQREEICMGWDNNFTHRVFVYGKQVESKKRSNYVDSLKNSIRREENKARITPFKIVPYKQKFSFPTKEKDDKKNRMIRRNPSNRNQYIFLGYCYSCNNFGHKEVHYRAYKYNPRNVQRYENNKNNAEKRNYSSFSPLQDFNIECQKCNNYGHKASECRFPKYSIKASISNIKENYKKIWRRKDKVQRKENDEVIASEIDKIDNKRMMGEVSNKVYENQSYAYKVDQAQEKKTPKEKCDTIAKLNNVLQINYPLPNKWKLQKENSEEKDKEAFVAQNSDDDDEISKGDQPEELSDDVLGNFQTLF
jgi:hypothetical protein